MHLLVFIAVVAMVLLLGRAFRRKPPPSTSVDPEVIAAFRKIYRQQMLLSIPTAVFLVWVFRSPFGADAPHGSLLLITGLVVVWVCVHTYRHWRCPKCGAYLGRNPMYNWQCPSCGAALREPRKS